MDGKITSPKIEIINHFDNLIQQVDIDIEESLEKYNEEQILRDLECYKTNEMMMNRRRNQADYRNNFRLYESSLNKPYDSKYNWSIDAKEKEKLTITVFPRTPSVNTLWLEDTINFFTRQCSKCGSCSGWNCKIEVDENTRLGCNCRKWGKLSIEIIDTSGDKEDLLYVIEPRATSLTWATPIEVLDAKQ